MGYWVAAGGFIPDLTFFMGKKRYVLILLVFLLGSGSVCAQDQNADTAKVQQKDLLLYISKYIRFKKRKPANERKIFFSFLPLSGASTNGNSFVVTSINATF